MGLAEQQELIQQPLRPRKFILKQITDHKKATKYVLGRGLRPPVPYDAPEDLQLLLCDMWLTDPSKRPNFTEIIKRLEPFLSLDELPNRHRQQQPSDMDEEAPYIKFPFNALKDSRTDMQRLLRNAADPENPRERRQRHSGTI